MSLRNRAKRAWSELKGQPAGIKIDPAKISPEQLAEMLHVDEPLGDGKAEFLGEGTVAEFEEQQKADNGTLPWYKRILRDE